VEDAQRLSEETAKNNLMQAELGNMRRRDQLMQEEIARLLAQNQRLSAENARNQQLQAHNQRLRAHNQRLEEENHELREQLRLYIGNP
jgi:hypothetical protein